MQRLICVVFSCFLMSGCLGSEILTESSKYGFVSETLNRDVDGGEVYDIRDNLSRGAVLVMFSHHSCYGCHEWVGEINQRHNDWMSQENPIQPVMVGVYPPSDDAASLMETYGSTESEHYTNWPVVVTTSSSKAWNLERDVLSDMTIFEAFDNPNSPELYLIGQTGDIIWKSGTYQPTDEAIMEMENSI
ncbi:MAG: hypothetical protein CMA25_06530 [Euryarchaeota archaeon]|nr:hypothetical protein [Euryarchaeota archaeon]